LRPLLFWDITRFGLVAGHRRFGTTYRFHLPVSKNPKILLGPCRWDRYVVPKRRQPATNPNRITSQNNDLDYTAASQVSNYPLKT